MPAVRPCAAFEPISPDLDLSALVESTPNFEYVTRIHCDMIDIQGIEAFEKLVLLHVILGGKPLVIEGYQERLERWTFAVQWLKDNCASKVENARDLTTKSNLPLTIAHYLNNMGRLTDQWTGKNYKDPARQRIYLKDIDCPQVWHDRLKEMLTPSLFYYNDCIGEVGGPGSIMELDPHGHGMRIGKGIAKAGDLMSCLPEEMRAENLMCYIGHEGTYTPAHREMCASLGQNIMVETSTGVSEAGSKTKPGSSIWFMTEKDDREVVSEYWLSTLGHDIEVESHLAQINAWKAAPFKVYVVEQKVGDFILIPPLAPHQVWNRGTRTMKVAWNRTTIETLEHALDEALPRARMVCRDEQYKNKAIIYYSLVKYSTLLQTIESQKKRQNDRARPLEKTSRIRQLQKDFRRLLALYTRILVSESFATNYPEGKKMQFVPFESNITCSYCRCNIFNRFLTCSSCISVLPDGEDDTYDICMECYAMGRSCACISKLNWVEQFDWDDLVNKHETWRLQILKWEQDPRKIPQALFVEREAYGKKTVAQICQEELKRRPFSDITKPVVKQGEEAEEFIEVDQEGRPRKKRKIRRSEKWQKEHASCHICGSLDPKWKQAACTLCGLGYCYGSLFRAFNIMPQTVLEDPAWKCPKCLMICSCATCRKDPKMNPFQPTATMLGHDTSKVADPRSVESLVDFSKSNMHWLKAAGDDHPHGTRRLKKRQEEAEKAKSRDPHLGDDYVDHDAPVEARLEAALRKEFALDPLLAEQGEWPDSIQQDEDAPYENDSRDQQQFFEHNQLMYNQDINEHVQHGLAEGIKYLYPDPEHSQYFPISSTPTDPEPEAVPEDNAITLDLPRRKRPSGNVLARADIVEYNADQPSQDKVQGKQGKISKPAKSATSRKRSLIVKLPVKKSKLVELYNEDLRQSLNDEDPTERQIEILQSDLLPEKNPQDQLPQVLRTKIRLEPDDDFAPRKARKSRTKFPLMAKAAAAEAAVEVEEFSDDELDEIPSQRNYSSVRNHSRSESKWLKLRKGSEDNSTAGSLTGAENGETTADETVHLQRIAQDALPKTNGSETAPVTHATPQGSSKASSKRTSAMAIASQAAERERKNEALGEAAREKALQAEQMEANRKAKLDAMRWAEGDGEAPSESDHVAEVFTNHKSVSFNMDGTKRDHARPAGPASNPSSTVKSHNPSSAFSSSAGNTSSRPITPRSNGSTSHSKPYVRNAIRPSRGRG